MSLKETINKDLKTALLEGDKVRSETIKMIKSVILNTEIEKGLRDKGLDDTTIIALLKKEVKKRNEAAAMYTRAKATDRAHQEQVEATIIAAYIPAGLNSEQISILVDKVISEQGEATVKSMGKIISEVMKASEGQADGSEVACIVKNKVSKDNQ